jgi:hypothetical protein
MQFDDPITSASIKINWSLSLMRRNHHRLNAIRMNIIQLIRSPIIIFKDLHNDAIVITSWNNCQILLHLSYCQAQNLGYQIYLNLNGIFRHVIPSINWVFLLTRPLTHCPRKLPTDFRILGVPKQNRWYIHV